MSTLLSTSHVAAGERAAYWIDMICDVFVQLDCTRTAERFHGEIADQTLGPLRVSRVDSNKQLVLRSPRQIAQVLRRLLPRQPAACRPRTGTAGRPRRTARTRRLRAL